MSDAVIRAALVDDLEALAMAFGDGEFFADRFRRQQAGRGVLLTAWIVSQPVGDAYLWLEEAEEAEIAEHLPEVPLLTHVEIHPDHRNRGLGTELVWYAERMLADLDYTQVALAVRMDNVDAYRLYKRLGYEQWPHRPVKCLGYEEKMPDGNLERPAEICHVMVKSLAALRG
jgi:ribosomal protein S18 acetylase RimI-like enzyme